MNQNFLQFQMGAKGALRLFLPAATAVRRLCLLVMTLLSVQAFAQNGVITGTVKETSGTGLPGVNIVIKGTTQGTQTDVDGNYRLANIPANSTLIFSFIGKTTQEIPVGAQTVLNVVLEDDAKSLQEVVVIGYGSQRRQDLTGSIATVSAKDFQQGQITNPEQLVAGKIAGVQITPGSGAPGSGSQIRIRGGSSLNANNDPLIVIDGVPLDNTGVSGASNPLSFINPNDIETFTVLKDASATAIYGSRASNGVILITTKKGALGNKISVNASSIFTVSQKIKNLDVLSAQQFTDVVKAQPNAATLSPLLGTVNTNWQDAIFQTALSTDNNVSVSGALGILPYRISYGYLNQNGILKTSNLERNSASLNLTPRFLNNHLKVDLSLKGTILKNRFAEEGAIGSAVAFNPTLPIYSGNDAYGGYYEILDNAGKPNNLAPRNPLALLELNDNRSTARRSIGNIQLDYKFHFLPELRANLNAGFDVSSSEGFRFRPAFAASVFNQKGERTQYSQEKTNKTLEFYLNYVKDLSAIRSRLDVTAGYSYQDFLRSQPAYPVLNAEGAQVTPAGVPFKTQNTLVSFFGRANYTFNNKYLLTLTLRQDGSSRFNPDNRWGTFPSAAFAWKIKEENFLKGVSVLSDLKLRLGYGITGQQDVGQDFPYLARYTPGEQTAQYLFGNRYVLTYRPEGYDANIKWEETTTYNAGIDYGILGGRISGTLDYYYKETRDLLSVIPVAAGSNFTNQILTNVGNIRNSGIEFGINTTPVQREDFSLDVNFNLTYNKNEITNLTRVKDPNFQGVEVGGISGGTGNTAQVHSVGFPTFSYYVYQQVYGTDGKPLEGVYVDRNGDGQVTSDDRYRYKSPQPQLFLGFSSQATYKRWNAGFVMRGNFGNYVYNNVYSNMGVMQDLYNSTGFLVNRSTNVLETGFTNKQLLSDFYIQNASFVRMDNVNLGYNFGNVYKKLNVRATATVQNAFVITKYKGIDPEVAGGIDNNVYPRPRIYSVGLNVNF
ncbi:SusC/RagA family TonB-linked outer membrane protein [Tellurirhabdus rosea]|uniref:SusC/RagA family TonB-linked outer membrane protein n=1 Tax=Tellurirhabdus rosea TaxID=2674997 RepID=UPI0022556B3A|nr:TonB-dependent receptor [Tellurirhabdus rosea]